MIKLIDLLREIEVLDPSVGKLNIYPHPLRPEAASIYVLSFKNNPGYNLPNTAVFIENGIASCFKRSIEFNEAFEEYLKKKKIPYDIENGEYFIPLKHINIIKNSVNEIEVLDPSMVRLPNENWIYKVNNENDWDKLAISLMKQHYTWIGGEIIQKGEYNYWAKQYGSEFYIFGYSKLKVITISNQPDYSRKRINEIEVLDPAIVNKVKIKSTNPALERYKIDSIGKDIPSRETGIYPINLIVGDYYQIPFPEDIISLLKKYRIPYETKGEGKLDYLDPGESIYIPEKYIQILD